MITKQSILERKQTLVADRERTIGQLAQVQELLHTLNGAIQDCDWFISQLEDEGEGDSPLDDQ